MYCKPCPAKMSFHRSICLLFYQGRYRALYDLHILLTQRALNTKDDIFNQQTKSPKHTDFHSNYSCLWT